MPISDPPSHRTKWLLMKCLKLQPTLRCLLILTQHRHCSREGIRREKNWLDLEAISENNQSLVPWYTHICHLPHQILYVCVIFGHGKVMESRWNSGHPGQWLQVATFAERSLNCEFSNPHVMFLLVVGQPCICMLQLQNQLLCRN